MASTQCLLLSSLAIILCFSLTQSLKFPSDLEVFHMYSPSSPLRPSNHLSWVDTVLRLQTEDQARLQFLGNLAAGRNKSVVSLAWGRNILQTPTYIVKAKFGTPGQSLLLALDTSNDNVWIPCTDCVGCGKTGFAPAKSTTYKKVRCGAPQCGQVPGPVCSPDKTCSSNFTYGSSSIITRVSQDSIKLVTQEPIPKFTFGCIEKTTGGSTPPQGLLGLGRGPLSLLSQTYNLYKSTFSYCLPSFKSTFHSACHSGDDDGGDDAKTKLTVMSSNVFNQIMLFVLNEMDGILRKLLKLPRSGGNKEMVADLMSMKQWKHNSHLVKSYLGNALHVLNQMTNVEMISFTLRRLRYSSVLLSAFPALLRKYIKVILHYWTGGGALPIISFLFLRDLCMQLGSDCVEECFKGMYKTYVEHCHYVNASNLQHIQFLGNCFIELLRVDLPAAYQHGFVFIRQLAMVLTNAMTNQKKDPKNDKKQDRKRDARPEKKKDKELIRKVYEWKYINCLELWTGAICTYSSEADLRPLAYPLTQIITGVARLVPSAQYFPLRLRCVRMLNRIAASTGTYIPVSLLLVDMLEMKELYKPATEGVGEAVDLRTTLKVSEKNLKTRAFQEACVFAVAEELTEHLAQWSYSIAFFELSVVPAVRLRNFCKSTKVERFRREMRQLIRQIESNSNFTNKKRMSVTFLPNDPAATTYTENEKISGDSPLSAYAETLRKRAQQRNNSLMQSSVLVGERSAAFSKEIVEDDSDDDNSDNDGADVFNSSWLPSGNKQAPESEKKKKQLDSQPDAASDEDLVEDLVLSDEDDSMDDMPLIDDVKPDKETSNHQSKKRKFGANSGKRTKQQKPKKRKNTK